MLDTRAIARAVPMRQALQHFRVRIHRGDRRADCPFCDGNSKGTVSFTPELWKCHRCGKAGDLLNLIKLMNRCTFGHALEYAAGLAGVRLDRSSGAAEIHAQQRRRAQEQAAADAWTQRERELRIQGRQELYLLNRVERLISKRAARDDDDMWAGLQAADELKRRALATYLLLSFGSLPDRYDYSFHPENRGALLEKILSAGAVGQYQLEALL